MVVKFKDIPNTGISAAAGTYDIAFISNGVEFTKFRISRYAVFAGELEYYNSTNGYISVYRAGNWVDAAYKLIYIDDSVILPPAFETGFLANSTSVSGIFDKVDNKIYQLNSLDIPESIITTKFITSSAAEGRGTCGMMTSSYASNNFNPNIFGKNFIYFRNENNGPYSINFSNQGAFYSSFNVYSYNFKDTLSYNSMFYYSYDDACMKAVDAVTGDEFYLAVRIPAGTQLTSPVIQLSDTIPGSKVPDFIDGGRIRVEYSDTTYYFNGTITSDGWLQLSANEEDAVHVYKESTTEGYSYNDYIKNSHYYIDDTNLSFCQHVAFTANIAGNSGRYFPYQKLPTISDDGSNIFSGDGEVDGEIRPNLTYVLPNTRTYNPMYYKKITVTNNTSIANIPLKLGKKSSDNQHTNEQYVTGRISTSRLNTSNTAKDFITSISNTLNEGKSWDCGLDRSETSIRDADRACYFSDNITLGGYNVNDFGLFNLNNNNLNYSLSYSKFPNISEAGLGVHGRQTIVDYGGMDITPGVHFPSYIYSSPIPYGNYEFNSGNPYIIYITSLDKDTPNAYISIIEISGSPFIDYQLSLSNKATFPLSGGNIGDTMSVNYNIGGCPKFIQISE